MKISQILFAISLMLPAYAGADAWGKESAAGVLNKISDVQKSVQMNPPCPSCELAQQQLPVCSQEVVCQEIRKKKTGVAFALAYQNEDGEKYVKPQWRSGPFVVDCTSSEALLAIGKKYAPAKEDLSLSTAWDAADDKNALEKWNLALKPAQPKWEKDFADVKTKIKDLLLAQKNSENSKQIDNALKRLSLVKLKIPGPKEFDVPMGQSNKYYDGCTGPNAFFTSDGFEVIICPDWLNSPRGMRIDMLAHELAHSFDPCNMTNSVKKTKRGQVEAYDTDAVKKTAGPYLVDPLKFKDFPLKTVMQCIADPNSAGIPFVSTAEAMKAQEEFLRTKLSEFKAAGSKEDIQTAKEGLDAVAKDRKRGLEKSEFTGSCYGITKSIQVGEAFSDWVASQIVSSYLEEEHDPVKKKQLAVESLLYVANDCHSVQESDPVYAELESAYKKCGKSVGEMQNAKGYWYLGEPHPPGKVRVERLRLGQAAYQNALSCRPDTVRVCR